MGTARATTMRRVAVMGNSGSGKTTLARAISRRLDLPHLELDAVYHQPNWTPLDDDLFRERVAQFTASDRWVVDGNYSAVRDLVWGRADTLLWLDLPRLVVMTQVIRRTLRRMALRQELWNGNREEWRRLLSFDPDRNIIAWSWTRHTIYRRMYAEATAEPVWSGLHVERLTSTRAVRGFVAALGTDLLH